jgi:hypothetical protein
VFLFDIIPFSSGMVIERVVRCPWTLEQMPLLFLANIVCAKIMCKPVLRLYTSENLDPKDWTPIFPPKNLLLSEFLGLTY